MRICSHKVGGVIVLSLASASAGTAYAGVNLVFNGDFETGNLAGWTAPPPAPPPQGRYFEVTSGGGAHGGNYYAVMSSWNLQYMSQFLPDTVAGTDYELEFWVRNPTSLPPGFGHSLIVRWEGVVVANPLIGGPDGVNWTMFTIPVASNFSGSFLEFGQLAFPGELHIDTISVRPVPAPSAMPLLAVGGLVAFRRCRR